MSDGENKTNIVLPQSIKFRPMELTDLDQILAIENSVYTHAWTKQIMIDCIRSGHHCWVLLLDGKIIGYSVLSVAVGESHLLNISIHAAWQRCGLGRKLLHHMLVRARALDAYVVFLEVRVSNKSARKLYSSEGFDEVGRRKEYYPGETQREDALVLSLTL